MEAEPTEAAASLAPAVEEEEEAAAAPSSTSPTAREVEEELIPPASTSPGSDEDTVLPRSSSLEGEDELPDPSLPSSSEWPEPRSASPSEPSAAPPESSPFTFSSPSPSSLSWKAPSDGLQRRLEEAEGRGEQGERTKAKKKGLPAKKGAPSQWESARAASGPAGSASGPGRGRGRGRERRDAASLRPPGWPLAAEERGGRQRSGWSLSEAPAQQRRTGVPSPPVGSFGDGEGRGAPSRRKPKQDSSFRSPPASFPTPS